MFGVPPSWINYDFVREIQGGGSLAFFIGGVGLSP
jgi:hypothetical protein